MNLEEFETSLSKRKEFRNLEEQYKTPKFILLYSKIYEYILSIPKEKIQRKKLDYKYILFLCIFSFIKAKDFYNWKERVYKLTTEKLHGSSYIMYELLYRSKAKEFFELNKENRKKTCLEKYGVEFVTQSEEFKEQSKATCMKKYGVEYYNQTKEFRNNFVATMIEKYGGKTTLESSILREKVLETNREKYGHDYPAQNKEIFEKVKKTNKEKYGVEYLAQSKEIQNKMKATNKERHGVEYPWIFSDINTSNHSKFGDEVCLAIDNLLGNPEDSMYATKNREYSIKTKDGHIRKYDYCIPSLGVIVEADGIYSHGLLEGQEYSYGRPVEEVWKYDQEKENLAIQNGYKVFHLREDEYYNNPEECINNIINNINIFIKAKENEANC